MAKRGLKIRDVAKDHFSSGIVQSEPHFSRLVIRFLEGKELLASDIETGKSDPVSFVWCGPINDTPILEEADLPESGILRTSVCPTTINPIWNEDVIFPLDITDIKSFTEMKCLIYVRDEDLGAGENGMTTYDELGMLELPFKDIYTKGKAFKNSIVISGTWYTLAKSPGMRRVDGQVKLTISLIFAPEDNDVILKQLPSAAESTNFSRSSIHQLNSVSQKVQRYLTNPAAMEAEASKVDPRLRLSMSSLGRPSSAKTSSRSTFSVASIAPMVRRPSTAPQKRPDEAQLLAAVREKKEKGKPRRRSAGDDAGSLSASENENDDENDENDDEEEDGEDLDEILEEEEEQEEGEEDNEKEEPGSDDELIVMKPSAVKNASKKNAPKPSKRYDNKSESHGDSNNVGVDVGGYDLSELLPTDKDSKQAMEDIITVGVNQITASLDSDLFKVHGAEGSQEQKDQAVEVAKKIKTTAAEMAKGGSGSATAAPKDPPVAKQPLQPSPTDPQQPLSEEELLSGRAPPGDEGVLEEVVNLAVRGVATALQSADVEYMGALRETGKLVAKTAKNVAGEAGQAVKSIASKAAQELNGIDTAPLVKGAAIAAKQQLHHLVANPVETVVSGGAGTVIAIASEKDAPLPEKDVLKKLKTPTNAAAKQQKQSQQGSSNKESYAHPHLAGSDSDQGPLVDPLLMMIGGGDFAENPDMEKEENSETPELTNSPQQRKARPISAPSTHNTAKSSNMLTPNSGALVAYEGGNTNEAQLQLQADLKQQAQGHATAVVRALKEMSSQRKVMEMSLEKIATATAAGFSKLSERISHLEDALLLQHHMQGGGGGPGDQNLPPEEEEEEEAEQERSNPRRSASRNRLNNTTPARLEGKAQALQGQGQGRAGSVPRGGRSNTTSAAASKESNNNKKETTAGNARSKGATSACPPKRPVSAAATKKDTFGNVGAIAAAKAQARASKRKLAHPPYASFEDSMASSGNSSSNFHFQPSAQILFRGADGRVESSTLAAPPAPEQPNALQYQQQQQQQQMQQGNNQSPGRPYSNNGFINPNSNDNNNNYGNNNNYNGYNDPYNQSHSNNNSQNSNLNSYYPTPNSNPYNPALQNSAQNNNFNGTAPSNNALTAYPQPGGGVKYPLNKEFSGVLERGSLEDIARLLESTAPRPEDLSASVRNRLYDAVATLLHQNSHTERCLMWVLALLRGPSALLNEVVGHTVRDLREALETVALEASKRGLLASLLKSQIHR
eukprot:gene14613-16768_t